MSDLKEELRRQLDEQGGEIDWEVELKRLSVSLMGERQQAWIEAGHEPSEDEIAAAIQECQDEAQVLIDRLRAGDRGPVLDLDTGEEAPPSSARRHRSPSAY